MTAPEISFVAANGLRHRVFQWQPAGPAPEATVLCAHGFLDCGGSWRQVAEALAARGHRVLAFDWRGHGHSDRVGAGGYYHFLDYVADLAELVEALVPGPLQLVGHSMGGTACLLYAGSFPERPQRLVLMEGLGPPAAPNPEPAARIHGWIETAQSARARRETPKVLANLDDAVQRLQRVHAELGEALGRELAGYLTRPAGSEDSEARVWGHDPLHLTRGPYPFNQELFLRVAAAIRCPTLIMEAEHGLVVPDQATRRQAIAHHRLVQLAGVGHMMHWHAPEAVAEKLHEFLCQG